MPQELIELRGTGSCAFWSALWWKCSCHRIWMRLALLQTVRLRHFLGALFYCLLLRPSEERCFCICVHKMTLIPCGFQPDGGSMWFWGLDCKQFCNFNETEDVDNGPFQNQIISEAIFKKWSGTEHYTATVNIALLIAWKWFRCAVTNEFWVKLCERQPEMRPLCNWTEWTARDSFLHRWSGRPLTLFRSFRWFCSSDRLPPAFHASVFLATNRLRSHILFYVLCTQTTS